MGELVPEATRFEPVSDTLYRVIGTEDGKEDVFLGYINSDRANGYGGPIEVAVFLDRNGRVKNLSVMNNIETPSFFLRVMAADFLEVFKGKEVDSYFRIGQDIDGVSGATITSKGITAAVKKSAYMVASSQLSMKLPDKQQIDIPVAGWYILGLLVLVLLCNKFKLACFRYGTLLAGLIIIGFWQKSPISLGNIASLLGGNIPSLEEIPIWFLLVIGVVFLIIFSGKNIYCFWMCPMGALAEFSGKLGEAGKMTYRPCAKRAKQFRGLRLFLAWGAMVVAFMLVNPSISSYEIFAPLFAHEGNPAQWVLLPFMLFIGVIFNRFWCRFFCPVGGILDFFAQLRRGWGNWIKMRVEKRKTKIPSSMD
jgi:uncharacterized protein with FMN-binding domain